MPYKRKYRPDDKPIESMAELSEHLDAGGFTYLERMNRPLHPGWVTSMSWLSLGIFVGRKQAFKALENK